MNEIKCKRSHKILTEIPGTLFSKVMAHGSMPVEIYRPAVVDNQKPHIQDELYVTISGSGNFYLAGERFAFKPGDVIFVPAEAEHRFEDFKPDFATWVIFYGPLGGEGKRP